MNTHSFTRRTGFLAAIVLTLSSLVAANVASELAVEPAAAAGAPRPAASGGLPVLPEVVVTATRLEA